MQYTHFFIEFIWAVWYLVIFQVTILITRLLETDQGHLKMGTFARNCQKCPYSGAQKWDFKRPNPKMETIFPRQHLPKMVGKHFVSCFYHFRNRLNLKKCTFKDRFKLFSLSTDPKIEMQCKRPVLKKKNQLKVFLGSQDEHNHKFWLHLEKFQCWEF